MDLSFDHRPADRAGAGDNNAAIAIAVCADAGSVGIGGDDDFAERKRASARGGKMPGLARSGQSEAGDNPRAVSLRHAGAVEALIGGFQNCRKALLEPEPQVRRTGFGLAEDCSHTRTQPRPAVRSAAIYG